MCKLERKLSFRVRVTIYSLDRAAKELLSCKNQQERSSAYERRRGLNAENLVDSPLVYERRATPLVRQDKRWSLANERKWRNSQDDYGRHDSGMERTLSAEFEWKRRGFVVEY